MANNVSNTVTVYPLGSSTSTALYTISGLNGPVGVALDAAHIYVSNNGNNTVTVYPIGSSTSTALYTISGLNGPVGVALDAAHIYVANNGNNTVPVYPLGYSPMSSFKDQFGHFLSVFMTFMGTYLTPFLIGVVIYLGL